MWRQYITEQYLNINLVIWSSFTLCQVPCEIIFNNIFLFLCLQTFFSKFYSVDKDMFPDESDHVNKIAAALTVSC